MVTVATCRIVATKVVEEQISMKVKETAQVPTNDGTKTDATEETEALWVDIEGSQQEHDRERPELIERL